MIPRIIAAALVGLAAIVFPLAVHTGGGTARARSVAAPAGPDRWSTVIRVSRADALAIDLRGNPNSSKWGYVADYFNNTVVKFGTGGARLASWSYGPETRYKQGVGLAVGGSGNVFVADVANGRIVKFDPFGRQLAVFGGFSIPRGVALDRQGNIYVAEQGTPQVTKLSPSGQVLARWHVPWANGTGTALPTPIAVDRHGTIYVGAGCYQDNCPPPHGIQYAVIELDPSGVMQGNLLGNNPYTGIAKGEQPFVTVDTVAVDRKDNLYVGGTIRGHQNSFSQGILVYGGGRHRKARYTLPGSGVPAGIAFDGRNRLYVAYSKRVLKRGT